MWLRVFQGSRLLPRDSALLAPQLMEIQAVTSQGALTALRRPEWPPPRLAISGGRLEAPSGHVAGLSGMTSPHLEAPKAQVWSEGP